MNRPLLSSFFTIISYMVAGFWPTLILIITICIILRRKEILVFSLYLSFLNMAAADYAPSWGGVCGAILAIFIFFIKNPNGFKIKEEKKYLYLSGGAFIILLCLNYLILSNGAYFEKTAIKSLIQQVVFVFLFVLFSGVNGDIKLYLHENIKRYMLTFVIFYTFIFFFNSYVISDSGRFGGGLGAQSLAFILTLLLSFFAVVEKDMTKSLIVMACTIPTLSRTYLVIQLFLIAIMFIQKERKFIGKILYSMLGIVTSALLVIFMPLLSRRLDYYDEDFFGTLLGRISNYENSINMIKEDPILGSGVGSMVKVLEGWVKEFYEYYLASGDTTIMHNEYLRILTETGFLGLSLFLFFIYVVIKENGSLAKYFMGVFLVGSMLENTIALYSGPIVALALLISSKPSAYPLQDNNK